MTSYEQRYKRSASILNRKYSLYMIPALLSAAPYKRRILELIRGLC